MLLFAKKRIASIIVGGPKPSYVQKIGDDSGTGEFKLPDGPVDSGVPMELEAGAEDILRAIAAKDAKALAAALMDFAEIAEGCGEGDAD